MERDASERSAEHIESIFGVELNNKIVDEIVGLENTADILKELADDILTLKETDHRDFNARLMNCKATAKNCEKALREKERFFSFYMGERSGINQVILERDLNMLLCQILKWNRSDVRELSRWVKKLKNTGESLGFRLRDLIRAGQIPSEGIPEEILRYPTWAVDRQGYCLTGDELDEIMHIDEVRDEMEADS